MVGLVIPGGVPAHASVATKSLVAIVFEEGDRGSLVIAFLVELESSEAISRAPIKQLRLNIPFPYEAQEEQPISL